MNISNFFSTKKCQFCQKGSCNCKKDVDTLVSMGFPLDSATSAYLSHPNLERAVTYLTSLPEKQGKPKPPSGGSRPPNSDPSPRQSQQQAQQVPPPSSSSQLPSSQSSPSSSGGSSGVAVAPSSSSSSSNLPPRKENDAAADVVMATSASQEMPTSTDVMEVDQEAVHQNGVSAKERPLPKRPTFKLELVKGTMLDVRDSVGKWVGGEIVTRDGNMVTINFLGWDAKWNEDIDVSKQPYRFAPFSTYSTTSGEAIPYKVKEEVWVCPLIVEEFPEQWVSGCICQIDDKQVQVEFTVLKKKYQRWFHVATEEIKPGDYIKPPPDPFHQDWFVGRIIEVKDTVEKWEPAEILKIDKPKIYITYINWTKKWNEWLDVTKFNSSRIRFLGAALRPGEEEKKKKEEEEKFRKDMWSTHGFKIVEMDRDGNCLFRSVAHQIFNDPSRHAEVREKCYDYMVANREFFEKYVSEEFDSYVKSQRNLNKWGDHVEIVALREIYNKNLLVFDRNYLKDPRPIGLLDPSLDIKTIRLSYHGSNHYNSVIDPKDLPPFGDGKDSKISIRDLRLQQDKKRPITQLDGKKMFPLTPEITRGLGRQRSFTGLRRLRITISDFDAIWRRHETTEQRVWKERFAALLDDILVTLIEKLRAAVSDKVVDNAEALRKTLEELRSEEWRNKMLAGLAKEDSVVLKDYRDYYDKEIEPEIFSLLEKQ